MCRSPIRIRNPNYKIDSLSKIQKRHSGNINFQLKNITDRYIDIPCGKCPDCVHLRQQYIVQRTICESFDNDLYFLTLTYNNENLPHINVNGYNIAFADISHVQKMLKRVRQKYKLPSFRYICVSEFGKSTNRPHFHLLLSFPKIGSERDLHLKLSRESDLFNIFLKEWSVNVGSDRKPVYKPLCTYYCGPKGRNYDLHYVNPSLTTDGVSDVAFYVSKYMLKVNPYVDALKSALFYNTPDTDTFKEIWSKIRPRVLLSKGFGNPTSKKVSEHINNGIQFSLSNKLEYPVFINPITPHTSPLCPYYRRKFMNLDYAYAFYYQSSNISLDSSFFTEDYDPLDVLRNHEKKIKSFNKALDRDNYYDNSELDYDNDFIEFTKDFVGVPIDYVKLQINDLDYES